MLHLVLFLLINTSCGEENVAAVMPDISANELSSAIDIDPKMDDAGIANLLDSDVYNYTAEYRSFIYHYDEQTTNQTLTEVRSVLKDFVNVIFGDDNTAMFGLTKTGGAVQTELGLARVPGFYLHFNSTTIVRYTGHTEHIAILQFLEQEMGGEIQSGFVGPLVKKDGVYQINRYNYAAFVERSVFCMVYFSDTDCSICGSGSTLMAQLQEIYEEEDDQIVFGVYAVKDDMQYVADTYNVTSIPTATYHFFTDKQHFYKGDFTKFDIKMFITGITHAVMQSYVVDLTADRINRYLNMKPAAFVRFTDENEDFLENAYMDKRAYHALAVMAQSWAHPCVFAEFNVTTYPDAGHELKAGFIYLYKFGLPHKYELKYTYLQDYNKMKKVSESMLKTIGSRHPLLDGVSEQVVVVGLFPNASNANHDLQTYLEFSINTDMDIELVHSTDIQTARRFNVVNSTVVVIYPTDCSGNGTTIGASYHHIDITQLPDSEYLIQALEKVLQNPAHFPLLCGADYRGLYYGNREFVHVLVKVYIALDWGVDGYSHMKYWSDKMKPLARKYRSKNIYFALADEETNYDEIHYMNLREGTISEVLFTVTDVRSNKKYYPKPEELDSADSIAGLIEEYITKLIANQLVYNIHSEPAPTDAVFRPGVINKVVGSTTERFMTDGTFVGVLVVVGEHDEEMLKTLKVIEALAVKHANTPHLVFGKLDSMLNEVYFKIETKNGVYVGVAKHDRSLSYQNYMTDMDELEIDIMSAVAVIRDSNTEKSKVREKDEL